jgi:hypothetical protein
MFDESRDRFRRSYNAGRVAYHRESLANNYSYPATLIAILVPASLVATLFVWLKHNTTLSFIERCGIFILVSALLQHLSMRIHNRIVRKK